MYVIMLTSDLRVCNRQASPHCPKFCISADVVRTSDKCAHKRAEFYRTVTVIGHLKLAEKNSR
jgi:hypothetical protein